MDLPGVSDPPWGFVEWFVTGISTLAVSGAAFVWRVMARLDRMAIAIDHQRVDLAAHVERDDAALTQMREAYFGLRATIGALPTRNDLRDLEAHIDDRMETLGARIDRAIESRGAYD